VPTQGAGRVRGQARRRSDLVACASIHGQLAFFLQLDGFKGRVTKHKVAGLGAPKVEKCVAKVLGSLAIDPPGRPTWVVGAIELIAPAP
jgi:hypothetical protein